MQLDDRHRAYWRRTVRLTVVLLSIWFVVTFVMAFFARDLARITVFGWPLSFYMAAQGALIVYVAIVWYYARAMRKLDKQFGVAEADE